MEKGGRYSEHRRPNGEITGAEAQFSLFQGQEKEKSSNPFHGWTKQSTKISGKISK